MEDFSAQNIADTPNQQDQNQEMQIDTNICQQSSEPQPNPFEQATSLFEAIGVRKDVDVDTSETSSYSSDKQMRTYTHNDSTLQNNTMRQENSEPTIQSKKSRKQQKSERGELDEDEQELDSTYAKFKTVNEVDINEIFKMGPTYIKLDNLDQILDFGTIVQFISQGCGMILVQPTDSTKLFDIENLVCFKDSRQTIGFIYELVGQITCPLYSIQLYPEFIDWLLEQETGENKKTFFTAQDLKERLHGVEVCVVKRTLRLINTKLDDLMAKKGCDASNMFDEEVREGTDVIDYSDDELERQQKKTRKQQLAGKKRNMDMEEGEISEENDEPSNKFDKSNKRMKQSKFREAATIPMYTTNMSAAQPQHSHQNQAQMRDQQNNKMAKNQKNQNATSQKPYQTSNKNQKLNQNAQQASDMFQVNHQVNQMNQMRMGQGNLQMNSQDNLNYGSQAANNCMFSGIGNLGVGSNSAITQPGTQMMGMDATIGVPQQSFGIIPATQQQYPLQFNPQLMPNSNGQQIENQMQQQQQQMIVDMQAQQQLLQQQQQMIQQLLIQQQLAAQQQQSNQVTQNVFPNNQMGGFPPNQNNQ